MLPQAKQTVLQPKDKDLISCMFQFKTFCQKRNRRHTAGRNWRQLVSAQRCLSTSFLTKTPNIAKGQDMLHLDSMASKICLASVARQLHWISTSISQLRVVFSCGAFHPRRPQIRGLAVCKMCFTLSYKLLVPHSFYLIVIIPDKWGKSYLWE